MRRAEIRRYIEQKIEWFTGAIVNSSVTAAAKSFPKLHLRTYNLMTNAAEIQRTIAHGCRCGWQREAKKIQKTVE
jgi:hypothetical protein